MGRSALLPDAPVENVTITIKFAPSALFLNVPTLAKVYARYTDEFPLFSQIPNAGLMAYKLSQLDGSEPVIEEPSIAPRLHFSEKRGPRSVMFQQDRLSFAWDKSSMGDKSQVYPGFDDFISEFRRHVANMMEFFEEQGFDTKPSIGEIAYSNRFRTRSAEGESVRLSSIYSFLNPRPASPVRINGYSHAWNERLVAPAPEGYVGIQAFGPLIGPEGVPMSQLDLTGAFDLSGSSWLNWSDRFSEVRDSIGSIFRRVVRQGAPNE